MISKIIYSGFLSLFVFMFFSTTNLPRLIYSNFIAPAPAAQQIAPVEANQHQQKIKRATTSEANTQKERIMSTVSVSTPKPQQQTPAQLGFIFAIGLLNLFLGFKIIRWVYRVFLKTPIYLIVAAFKFLIVKPYRYFTTPTIVARYEFSHAVPSSPAGSVIVQ